MWTKNHVDIRQISLQNYLLTKEVDSFQSAFLK